MDTPSRSLQPGGRVRSPGSAREPNNPIAPRWDQARSSDLGAGTHVKASSAPALDYLWPHQMLNQASQFESSRRFSPLA